MTEQEQEQEQHLIKAILRIDQEPMGDFEPQISSIPHPSIWYNEFRQCNSISFFLSLFGDCPAGTNRIKKPHLYWVWLPLVSNELKDFIYSTFIGWLLPLVYIEPRMFSFLPYSYNTNIQQITGQSKNYN